MTLTKPVNVIPFLSQKNGLHVFDSRLTFLILELLRLSFDKLIFSGINYQPEQIVNQKENWCKAAALTDHISLFHERNGKRAKREWTRVLNFTIRRGTEFKSIAQDKAIHKRNYLPCP